MITLKTQTPSYWQESFSINEDDLAYLRQFIIDHGTPVPLHDLVLSLIKTRCQDEINAIRHELSRGPLYQPKDSYQIGQTLIFPALQFAVGTVVGTRPGYDPSHGHFEVIQVRFEHSGEQREFASKLTTPHPLNRPDGENGLAFLQEAVSAEEIAKKFGNVVAQRLLEVLQRPDSGFIQYQGQWLVKEMLPEIHIGHLNLAEAIIDVAGQPMPPRQILAELGLPKEIPLPIQEFALNAHLSQDERFDDVGWDGTVLWFLRRLEPNIIVNPPARLQLLQEPYDRQSILPELVAVAKDIDFEPDQLAARGLESMVYKAHIVLTYPHWRSGTLPLSPQLAAMLPKGSHQHSRMEFIDGKLGETIVGWVHHEMGFIAGLERWYQDNQIVPGAFIRLERLKKPGVLLVDFEQRRMRREWVRVATVEDGRIVFSMQKLPIACQYDEDMAVSHADAVVLDEFVEQIVAERRPLARLLREIMPELVKLNPSGAVHAKTIYSAVNLFRRTPAGPVFALLSTDSHYVYVGNGMWTYNPERTRG